MNKQFFAQKGLVINSHKEVLLIKYSDSKFLSNKLNNKWAVPGGKIEIGETPKESIIREIKEETGVTCDPLYPIYIWNWEYKKDLDNVQINAVMIVCKYVSGDLIEKEIKESEVNIKEIRWVKINDLKNIDIVEDEVPGIEIYLSGRSRI